MMPYNGDEFGLLGALEKCAIHTVFEYMRANKILFVSKDFSKLKNLSESKLTYNIDIVLDNGWMVVCRNAVPLGFLVPAFSGYFYMHQN